MKYLYTLFFTLSMWSFVGAQESVVFYSNIDHNSNLVDQINTIDAFKISLGDNDLNIVKVESKEGIQLLGDKDIDRIHVDGRIDFDGIKKKNLCPGPEVKELDDKHVLISINSNWILDETYRYFAANRGCDIFNHIHMMEELEDVLEDYEEWNKIIVAHHPIRSISELDGQGMAMLNFIPIYGQLRRSFKANSGNSQDMPHSNYQRYIRALDKVLGKFDKVVFVSGHDKLNTVIQEKNITYINVNSGDRNYRSCSNEYAKYFDKGAKYLKFNNGKFAIYSNGIKDYEIDNPFLIGEQSNAVSSENLNNEVSSFVTASEKYYPTFWKNFWMGSGYRDVWSEPVKTPLLNIDKYDGGLKPYAIGGGLQTMSIKFKSDNGKKYAFRVLDKQPEKSLNEVLQQSIYREITEELITTMHPYAPLVASELLDATDIIHIKPELFILNKNRELSSQYKTYIGKIGTLEEKPKGKGKNRIGFYGADKVVTSYEMLLDLRESHKHKIDKMAYAKARLMDMFIGDWDRHEDNWKWAMFNEDGRQIYKPIPKDRDHTFSHWTGLIPNIADMFVMNAEDFDYKFGNLRQLNFKARFLDRQLAIELDLASWMEAVEYIQAQMTDETIDRAVSKFPAEVGDMHGATIAAKLKSRREDLPRAMREYYAELNGEVQIPASNKKDYAKIKRHDNGNVEIEIYHIKKDGSTGRPYYNRIFEYDLVDRIYLFGLDGKDVFEIEGTVDHTIPIEIIGGNGEDEIVDKAVVNKKSKSITVFDSYDEDRIEASENIKIKRPRHVAHYDPYMFDFNWFVPNAMIKRSSGNGWGLGVGGSYLTRGFNKVGFVNRYDILGVYYQELGAYRVDAKYTRKQAVGLNDLVVRSRFSTLYDQFPFFYGIGNDTEVFRLKRKERNRIDYNFYDIEIGLKRDFYTKSNWTNSVQYEHHDISNYNDLEIVSSALPGFGIQSFIGAQSNLNLDFTDSSLYPLDGSRLNVKFNARSSIGGNLSGNLSTRFIHYKTVDLGVKITFAGSINYKQSIGKSNFYHLSRIGSQSHFRGYTRNRFIDKYAFLYNSEVRLNLGAIQTPLIRFFVGFFVYHDGGQVWSKHSQFLREEWNNSYGGGFFVSPGWEQFAIRFTLGRQGDKFTYSKIQLGFDF